MDTTENIISKKQQDFSKQRKNILNSKKEYADMLSYSCGEKCRICPFPGAQCTRTGQGHRD